MMQRDVAKGLVIRVVLCVCLAIWPCSMRIARSQSQAGTGWPAYGGGLSGQRSSSLSQINRQNVAELRPVWTFHTHALDKPTALNRNAAFEATPVLWDRTLFFPSPVDELFAIDAVTGKLKWHYDPVIDPNHPRGIVTARGAALWHANGQTETPCHDRVLWGTLDARLIAVDARNGLPCAEFGHRGIVDMTRGVAPRHGDDYGITSPPTIVGDTVVVGSSIGDNRSVEEEYGVVRAYSVRNGSLLWSYDPIPWAQTQHPRTGAANAWSAIAADAERGILYVPTGSPSPDFWGGFRKGRDEDANSIVALDVRTGKKLWAFQLVHHDLWDYDLAAQPLLFEFQGPGQQRVPAVAVATKTGMVFVLNRLTGEPLFPVEERPVPASPMAGEWTSPTQPFSSLPPLAPLKITARDFDAMAATDREFCRKVLSDTASDGIFTPVSDRQTLLYPGSLGGVNWGSTALDPESDVLYANVNSVAFLIRLLPRSQPLQKDPGALSADTSLHAPDTGEAEISQQKGTPWRIFRSPFITPQGTPCAPQPWVRSVALNLRTGEILWSRAADDVRGSDGYSRPATLGLGGIIVTAGGLLFTGATADPSLRALDSHTGRTLWKGVLPAPAQSTPMTYSVDGVQYVVIAAGGHPSIGRARGDAVVAFALTTAPLSVPEAVAPGQHPGVSAAH